ncbi:hypothetical protein VTO42DRAFT_738 [Malbranchea cinnamomea]
MPPPNQPPVRQFLITISRLQPATNVPALPPPQEALGNGNPSASDQNFLQDGSPLELSTPPTLDVTVRYRAANSCPVLKNLPFRALSAFILDAIKHTVTALPTLPQNPVPVEVTVTINSAFADRIHAPGPGHPQDISLPNTEVKTFKATSPLGKPALLDRRDAFQYIIGYETAYNDLLRCTRPFRGGLSDRLNITSMDLSSSRWDPTTRLFLLSQMLYCYLRLKLTDPSWLQNEPVQGRLNTAWALMRWVVEAGNQDALRHLHSMLSPDFSKCFEDAWS